MSFFKRLGRLLASPGRPDDASYWYTVQCSRCGETIRGRIDLRNDLSIQYGETDQGTTYFVRKTLMGENRCFQPIEVEMTFNSGKKLIDRRIRGGKFVEDQATE